jgi:hypothetical protein
MTTARALLREHAGSHEEAADLFADAARRWERFGMPWERAQALLGQGRCFVASGRVADAAEPIREARKIFATLDAAPAVAVADDLLAAGTSATSPQDRAPGR